MKEMWYEKIVAWLSSLNKEAVPHPSNPDWLTTPAEDDSNLRYFINIEDKWLTCMLGPLITIREIPESSKIEFYEELLEKSGRVKLMEYAIFNGAIFCNLELDLTSCSKEEFSNALQSLKAGKDYFFEKIVTF